MGREIRRVPLDWEHPQQDSCPHLNGLDWSHKQHNSPEDFQYGKCFQPLFNETYKDAKKEWLANLNAWLDGTHPDFKDHPERQEQYDYWEWSNGPPDREYYRPEWDSEPIGYQIYETVSEGTPVSPVFVSEQEMRSWLIAEGYSEHATDEFIKHGWVFSFGMLSGKETASNIDIFDLEKDLGNYNND